jgi:ferritin-like metal-binding protein YciE
MGLITPNDFPSLQALYTAQLRYLLSTETQIVKGLADMIGHADDAQLKQAFQSHLQESEVHVSRLKQLIGGIRPCNSILSQERLLMLKCGYE